MIKARVAAAALGLVPLALAAAAPPVDAGLAVATDRGTVVGRAEGAARAWLGVPYAAPPVGANRWRAPLPHDRWADARPATAQPSSCMQPFPAPTFGPYTAAFVDVARPSEDCLSVDVWSPRAATRGAPVLVWFHGGGFLGGANSVPIYNGARLAAAGIVVVGVNYRLGPLGFLAHPGLSAEDPNHVSGNYGLLDQVAALRWVRTNIAAFGGDPARVTIAGQSAGAASVNDLLVSPLARGLFARAIAESGSGMGVAAAPLAAAEADGTRFAAYLHAPDVTALRALPAQRVQDALFLPIGRPDADPDKPRLLFRPVVDGHVLPGAGDNGASPVASPVPLLTGFNADENFGAAAITTPAAFEAAAASWFGAHAPAIARLYPHATDTEARASIRLMARDRYMAGLVAWLKRRTPGQTVYAYLFDHAPPAPAGAAGPGFGTFHTAEVPYLFGVLDPADRPYGAADRAISAQVQARWLDFIRTGNPGGAAAPWARNDGAGQVIAIGDRPGPRPAVSSPERLRALLDFIADGGQVAIF